MPDQPIRILVADDHPLVRDGLVRALRADGRFDVIGEASDGWAAVALAKELVPDCAVLDVRMPRIDGLEAMVRIRERDPGVRVVLLSAFSDELVIRSAVRAGAAAYLTKDTDRAAICEAIAQAVAD
ncbi:response regulator [Solirubrobacter soli]|uniref:response regulator n=1 Tax=Solirubrobacter soli TaxID=363832 RepID=UPI00146C78BA|nr:response regulator transcription factor [Solirubrobacter soli]